MFRGKHQSLLDSTPGAFHEKYQLSDRVLGKGSYAKVQMGRNKATGESVAVKILYRKNMKKNDFKKVEKEVEILKKLRHKNVIQVYDAYADLEENVYYIVMEYAAEGDLFKKIVDEEHEFNENEARDIIRTLCRALKYCVDEGIVHRDIKPDNILISKDKVLKIADFNLSKLLSKYEIKFTVIETQCGTPNYVAPEVLSGKPYSYKCDVWSVGVIMFLLLSGGFLPFFPDSEHSEDARENLLRKVREGNWSFEPEDVWEDVSSDAKDLIKRMMRKKAAARLSYEEILGHPWILQKETKHIEKAIDTSSLTVLKQRVDKMKSDKMLRSAGTAMLAASTMAELMLEDPENNPQNNGAGASLFM